MTRGRHSEHSPETMPLKRRTLLKLALAAGTVAAFDTASSYTLGSPVEHRAIQGEGSGTLSSAWPGFLAANIEQQTAPLQSTWNRYGDSLLFQPSGGVFDESTIAEYSAEVLTERLRKRDYGRVVLNGVSMGGNSAADTVRLLQSNRTLDEYSVEPSLVLYDTPASGEDVASSFKQVDFLADYRAGRVANLLPKLNGMDESLAISEAEAITDRKALPEGSLEFLSALVYWESLQGADMVNASASIGSWRKTTSSQKFRHVEVDMKHTAFEQNRGLARAGVSSIYAALHS